MATPSKPQGAAKLVLAFNFEKDTPGTLRFKEPESADGSRAAVGTLYITKEALNKVNLGDTRKLKVTIEAAG